ncbi:hypothetical protein OG625_31235 [Streptomyces sp. NBC_01351]|uniref:hypothetical protein n=1 Tax=Streptomyces sp. NBC_01351 TaxID=2903833 RepID=UPI002E30A3B7|nr:hypothetical protein [Streptomyces sp. NBC_01351]
MTQLTLALTVLAGAAAVYAVLGVLGMQRARADREAAGLLVPADLDPYHAVAVAGRAADTHRPAAAQLLLDGSVEVDEQGRLFATGRGPLPGHPLPAAVLAVLAALARQGPHRTTGLGMLGADPGLAQDRDAFLAAEEAKHPRLARARSEDGIEVVAVLTAMALPACYLVPAVVLIRPFSLFGGSWAGQAALVVLLAVSVGVPLSRLFADRLWPDRREPFRAQCAAWPPHPAITALDRERLARLDHKPPPRPDEWTSGLDTPGAF